MFRVVSIALSLLCAVASVACVEEAPTPKPSVDITQEPLVQLAPPHARESVPPPAVVPTHVDTPVLANTAPPSLLEREALVIEDGDLVDHRAEGLRLLAKGDSMNAIGELRKALSIDSSADVWSALGDAYLRTGDVARGVPCLEEAVSVDVDHLPTRRLLSRHFLSNNDGARARQHAEEWVRLQPQEAQSRQALGRSFLQLGMWKEAIDELTLVVAVQPDNAYAHNNLGFAQLQIGDNVEAVHALERVLTLKPQQGYMLNNLGVAYERTGRIAEAHAAFARAAELSPRYGQASLNRDRVQKSLNQAQRIVSADALLKLREGESNEFAPLGTGPADGAGIDVPAMLTITGE